MRARRGDFESFQVDYWSNNPGRNWGFKVTMENDEETEAAANSLRKWIAAEWKPGVDDLAEPHLYVHYNPRPQINGPMLVSPPLNGGLMVAPTTFTANVSDPGGEDVRLRVDVTDNTEGGPWPAPVYTGYVASGSDVSLLVDPGGLAMGHNYTMLFRASDGTGLGLSTGQSFTFTVAPAPTAPTITSTAWPTQSWLGSQPGSNTFTFTAPAATWFRYQIDTQAPVELPAAGNTATTGQVVPATPGPHTITAWTLDAGGNPSAPATFTYGWGTATLVTPTAQARTSRAFRVRATAPPGMTGAGISWRVAGTTTWTSGPSSIPVDPDGAINYLWDTTTGPGRSLRPNARR